MNRYVKYAAIAIVAAGAIALAVGGIRTLAGETVTSGVWVVGEDEGGGAYLGVQIEEETEYSEGGARVDEVVEDSPAAKAGLREGDIIVGFDGKTIRGPRSLTEKIHAEAPGSKVDVTVVRDGKRQTLTVELGERPKGNVFSWGPKWNPEEFEKQMQGLQEKLQGLQLEPLPELPPGSLRFFRLGRPKLGVQLVETTPELRVHLGGREDAGVLVGKVLPDTPAAQHGVQVGDLIVSVDGKDVATSGDLIDALSDKDGKTVQLGIVRDHRSMTLDVPLPEEEENDWSSGPQALDLGLRDVAGEARRAALEAARLGRTKTRQAMAEARRAYREAMRDVRGAALESRRAVEDARRARRDAAREAARAARKLAGSV
jgi:membrane-associated protease RseP (regulator of RpoE activity)